ncbi:MAG: hypothetical protein RSD49_14655, partial [Hafnia sp.]
MKPETYFGHLIDHWSLLTDLYRESRGQSFHENLFLKVAKRHDPTNFSMESGHLLLNALRKTTILELVPMSNKEFEFSQNALMNIEHWLSEQKLSLQAELVVRVEALQNLTSKIESSIDDHDLIKYHNTCNEMDRLLRAIKTQTDEAKVAVFRLVEEAKLFPKEMPLKKRYEKALDAWTTFVEPVVNMCNPNDQFSKTLSLIENTISVWIADDSLIMLSLESDKKRLEVIKARIIDFQDAIEMAASIMAKTITPIIKMIRLNTTITKGATLGLKILENSGPSKEWIAQMGMGIKKVKSSIRHGNTAAIESFMLEI